MSMLQDKFGRNISEGDYIDVRLRVTDVDEVARNIVARLGGGQLAMGTSASPNPSPDSARIIHFKPGDVAVVQ